MPLRILGVTHPISWNNGACLLVDGELVAMVEEERLNRFKHAPRVPPLRSIRYCLEAGRCSIDSIDHFAVGWDHGTYWMPGVGFKRYQVSKHYLHMLPFDPGGRNVHFVNHHEAHALASFLFSGFPEANVISLDATGGRESGLLGVGRGTKLDTLHRVSNDSSWGILYGTITDVLGFASHSDEGKVMGLAAYGTADPDAMDFIDWDREIPWIDRKRFKKYVSALKRRHPKEPLADDHKDLAATVQQTLERALVQMSCYLHDQSRLTAFCLGGGCALNCSANGKLLREAHVKDLFVHPAAHDVSTALGAAAKVHAEITGERPSTEFTHAYWGPAYSGDEVERLLKQAHLKRYERPSDIAEATADLLADGKIVGWFQGRMEVGPRALGGRSILADPTDPAMKDRVNQQVKGREPWRPFAPSFLSEKFEPYVERPHRSPFMILAFQGKKGMIEKIPSAAHVDGTVRVQTVYRETHPRYHALISAFEKRKGVPALLNTSFNVAGQPIVCSPFDAVSTFYASGLDALAIEDFLLAK
jgi:carbamoyltransferase